jgi:hypothetical protein
MAPTDPHQGGDLFDMAQQGTTMPNDAGEMNIIPSKPRPGESASNGPTNPTDIPRSFQDQGSGEEVETGTGYVRKLCRNRLMFSNLFVYLGIHCPLRSTANVCTTSATRT